jgi:hypothetical protein
LVMPGAITWGRCWIRPSIRPILAGKDAARHTRIYQVLSDAEKIPGAAILGIGGDEIPLSYST